jgi:hypothetical protein
MLHLNLYREFFAQIAAGTKRIEYRGRTHRDQARFVEDTVKQGRLGIENTYLLF